MGRAARLLALVSLAALALAAAACGGDDTAASSPASAAPAAPATSAPAVTGSITVFAAASLTDSFKAVGAAFTQQHPGTKVTFSFDASSALVQQITQGAPADLFASADQANMDKLTKAALNATPPVVFATNVLAIIVPKGNPKGITGVADLARPDLKVVLCADGVPCGTYAAEILAAAKVKVTPASLEQNVKGVVTKVTAGEADAGIVYQTDVTAAGDAAQAVAIPTDINVVAEYPIATVKASAQAATDRAFVDFLTSADGQAILAGYGFGPTA